MSKNDLVPKGAQSQAQSHDTSGTHIEKSLMIPNKADQRSKEAEPLNDIAVATPPSAPGSPAPGEKIINAGNRHYSPTSLETLLWESPYTKLPNSYDLPMLWSASRDPPITRATLSELDLQRLYHSLYLRHDLHFDRHIQFSPRSAYDTFGKQKRLEAQNYWDAVEIELALYGSYLEGFRLNLAPGRLLEGHCYLPAPRALDQVPLRLARMIQAVCRIVKTLVPPTKSSAVATMLDHEQFIRELEHGQCDIENLFKWVGALLVESCAPSRDAKIDGMINTISQGYRRQDPHILRRGLQDLFSILEIMKLDAANYQLQILREFMLSRSIEDEQNQIICWIKAGWEVPNWLDNAIEGSNTSFASFTTKFVLLITQPTDSLPTALALDHNRIQCLQANFRLLVFQTACSHALLATLHLLGWTGPLPASSSNDIASLVSGIEQDHCLDLTEQREALVLGIASHAYKLCATPGLPSPGVLRHTSNALHTGTQAPPSPIAKRIVASLSAQLMEAVEKELDAVKGLDALQLSNRYTSPVSASTVLVTVTSLSKHAQQAHVEEMARRIAHIVTLHWRVWAPILYLRRDGGES